MSDLTMSSAISTTHLPAGPQVASAALQDAPFAILQRMAAAASGAALPLPRATARSDVGWRGLGFAVGGVRFVARIGDAVEVLRMPRLTSVPWVKRFVLGLANVRGRLLPVFDLHELLDLAPTNGRGHWRVLVAQSAGRQYGLAVEQSFGLQQFAADAALDEPADLLGVQPFVDGGFRQGGRVWYALDLQRVVQDPSFANVAL